ncbi:preprotein translocase subunit SecG [Symmachiella macrocystis]|uniref:Protein-export membrane protein SecG n=1 Tax=Symmachiella macrocystis TaxID=2527985 RepID=A0A5C6BQS7_9PLAN|nr:preprotein translocase subunit SecG [Symmachiella macrocystis]TWU14408.1 preprotein translocase subunit SecG [Symmachiella macrocystis]
MGTFILVLLTITGLLLMFIILLQRGRGGGLAGALGGAGGQSAFGTKAGDVFTRITVGLAVFWVVLACVSIFVVKPNDLYDGGTLGNNPTAGVSAGKDKGDAESQDETPKADGDEAAGELDLGSLEEETQPATPPADTTSGTPEKQE